MHWKIDSHVITLLEMYWTIFSNTSGNVLKIVTNKDVAKFHKGIITLW